MVQYAIASPTRRPARWGSLHAALKFSEEIRARWEKAMAAAAQRFNADADDDDEDEDDDDDEEDDEAPANSSLTSRPTHSKNGGRKAEPKAEWSRHSANADVKVRGLARSFERDGVILFRGDSPLIRPELQAQLVESFARAGAAKGPEGAALCAGRPPGRARISGADRPRRHPPKLMALPADTVFDDWAAGAVAARAGRAGAGGRRAGADPH